MSHGVKEGVTLSEEDHAASGLNFSKYNPWPMVDLQEFSCLENRSKNASLFFSSSHSVSVLCMCMIPSL